jgi:hypothetical protein
MVDKRRTEGQFNDTTFNAIVHIDSSDILTHFYLFIYLSIIDEKNNFFVRKDIVHFFLSSAHTTHRNIH